MKTTFINKLLFRFLSFSIALGISNSLIAQNKAESVPEWAKKVVWYQIFPERFSKWRQDK